MNYSVYRISDGVVIRSGIAKEEDVSLQVTEGDGLAVLSGVKGQPGRTKVENGEVVPYTPPPPAPAVPTSVSPWQMRRALNQLGLRSTVEAAVAAADQDTKDGWEFATEFRRDNTLLLGMAASLNMADQDLDDLFTLAASFQ